MKKTAAIFLLASLAAGMLVGCSGGEENTVPKDVEDAYRARKGGTPPTAEQMKPKGPAFIGEPTSMPSPDNPKGNAGGPPPGATGK